MIERGPAAEAVVGEIDVELDRPGAPREVERLADAVGREAVVLRGGRGQHVAARDRRRSDRRPARRESGRTRVFERSGAAGADQRRADAEGVVEAGAVVRRAAHDAPARGIELARAAARRAGRPRTCRRRRARRSRRCRAAGRSRRPSGRANGTSGSAPRVGRAPAAVGAPGRAPPRAADAATRGRAPPHAPRRHAPRAPRAASWRRQQRGRRARARRARPGTRRDRRARARVEPERRELVRARVAARRDRRRDRRTRRPGRARVICPVCMKLGCAAAQRSVGVRNAPSSAAPTAAGSAWRSPSLNAPARAQRIGERGGDARRRRRDRPTSLDRDGDHGRAAGRRCGTRRRSGAGPRGTTTQLRAPDEQRRAALLGARRAPSRRRRASDRSGPAPQRSWRT